MARIVVVGSSNTDMVIRVPRIPAPGETVLGGAFATAADGRGANQAVAAARAGGEVALVAVGTNPEAVRLSGIDPRPVIVAVVILDAHRHRLAGRRFALWERLARRPGR